MGEKDGEVSIEGSDEVICRLVRVSAEVVVDGTYLLRKNYDKSSVLYEDACMLQEVSFFFVAARNSTKGLIGVTIGVLEEVITTSSILGLLIPVIMAVP